MWGDLASHEAISKLLFLCFVLRILRYDVPTTNLFILLQEGDVGFLTRTGWVYDPTVLLPVISRLAHCIVV